MIESVWELKIYTYYKNIKYLIKCALSCWTFWSKQKIVRQTQKIWQLRQRFIMISRMRVARIEMLNDRFWPVRDKRVTYFWMNDFRMGE